MVVDVTPTVEAVGKMNISGDITPAMWYRNIVITDKRGTRPYLEAITLLSRIVYWFRPYSIVAQDTNTIIAIKKRFADDKLQMSYDQLGGYFGFSYKVTREAIKHLEVMGVLTLEFRNIKVQKIGTLQNVMFIEVVPTVLESITYQSTNSESTDYPNGQSATTQYTKWESTDYPNGQAAVSQMGGTYTENTTEITNEEDSFLSAPVGAVPEEEVGSFKKFSETNPPNPDCALPLSPITIEELKVQAKELGCNGKSEDFASEFFHHWQAKDWIVNSRGARMQNVPAWFSKFIKEKLMPKEEVHPAYNECVKVFFEEYDKRFHRSYQFEPRDGKAMKGIIKLLEVEITNKVRREANEKNITLLDKVEVTPEQVVHAFKFILQKNEVKWVNDNLTPSNIKGQFNNIIISIRETHGNTGSNSATRNKPSGDPATRAKEAIRTKYRGNS